MDKYDCVFFVVLIDNGCLIFVELVWCINLLFLVVVDWVVKLEVEGVIIGYYVLVNLVKFGLFIECVIELWIIEKDCQLVFDELVWIF